MSPHGGDPLPTTAPSHAHETLAAHLGRDSVQQGDRAHVVPDAVLVGASAARALLGGALAQADASRWCCPHDGGGRWDEQAHALWERTAARGFALPADPSWPGVGVHVLLERGLVGSRGLVGGERPDAYAVGGVGALAWRLDLPALADLAREGRALVLVPRVRRVAVEGFLPRWAGPHDLALALRRPLREAGRDDGALPVVHELSGTALDALCVPGRIGLCEALGRFGLWALVPPDAKTVAWLRARCRDARHVEAAPAAAQAGPAEVTLRAEAARPRLLVLGEPVDDGAVRNVEGHEPLDVTEIVLGATLEQCRVAVETLRDRRVAPGVSLSVVPVTQRTLLHAVEEGLLAELLRAGAVVAPPGDVPGPARPGRLATRRGHPGDLLVSAPVATASAVVGRLVDPESMRRQVPRTGRRF